MVKTMTMDDFNNYTTPIIGEVICVIKNDEKLLMLFTEDGWQEIKGEINNGIQINLYDMNKQIISQLPALNKEEIVDRMIGIDTLHQTFRNEYYMLYGREISYFTLFKIINPRMFAKEVIDCLLNIGPIKAIDSADDALEIWVENKNEVTCLYLFPYDSGIVEVN